MLGSGTLQASASDDESSSSSSEGPGLIPRLCAALFESVQPGTPTGTQGQTIVQAAVEVSFCEIYNEMVSAGAACLVPTPLLPTSILYIVRRAMCHRNVSWRESFAWLGMRRRSAICLHRAPLTASRCENTRRKELLSRV